MDPQQEVNWQDFKIKTPATVLFVGNTSAGKTYKVKEVLDNLDVVFDTVPCKIVYIYAYWQEIYSKMLEKNPGIIFIKNVPDDIDNYFDPSFPSCLIIDDMLQEIKTDKAIATKVANFFVKGSHHLNTTVILLSQELFPKDNVFRTISTNSQYLFCFKNIRDSVGISILCRQICPLNWKKLLECFQDATSKAYNPMIFDLHPKSKDSLRWRCGLTPETCWVYKI